MKRTLLIGIALLCVLNWSYAQTLIINEVSQGASGNKEYVEFVVVDTAAFYDCGLTTPPCVDIRGWIFDDNSGYHGTGGVAAGANRFSNDPLWSCVELGTIILIYNDADPNPEIPADDLSTSDGNCVIIAPISDTSLFEFNSTTPGAIACSYPATGWLAGGDWSATLLANGGDCARLVDLAGCEVFSVCWGSNNLNTQIYFAGGSTSGTSATNTVYYFNGTDPTDQANWSIGCADVPACGVEEQTPGAINNAANASYIAQFNNGCVPLTPTSASVTPVNDCGCNGSATASGSGSIPGYTFEWTDNVFTPIGQTSPTATGLCSGDYNVIVTSSIGCADTASVTITNTVAPSAGSGGTIDLCSTDAPVNLQDSLTGSPDLTGVWEGPSSLTGGSLGTFDPATNSAGSYDYIVGAATSCPDTSVTVIVLTTPPTYTSGPDTICSGDSALFFVTNSATTLWTTSETSDSIYVNSTSTFSVDATNGCGTFTFNDSVVVLNPPVISINQSGSDTICFGDTLQLIANSSTGSQLWSTSETTDSIIVSGAGNYFVSASNFCGTAFSDTLFVTLETVPTISVTPTGAQSICPGDSIVMIASSSTGNQTWSTAETTGSIVISGAGNYFASTSNLCGTAFSDTLFATLGTTPTISVTPTGAQSICPGDTIVMVASSSTGSQTWSNGATTDTIYIHTIGGSFYATTSTGCGTAISDSLMVTILGCGSTTVIDVVIPNVFSPNDDGSNDGFHLVSYINLTDMTGYIFNRWGQILYQWDGLSDFWDGRTVTGEQAPDGTYYYAFEFTDINGENFTRTGHFLLVR